MLRAALPESRWVIAVERSVSWLAWIAVVLWITGALPLILHQRRESGAVIGPSEFDSGQKQYFPEYADKEDVLLNKAASRKQAIYNMYVSAGPRYREEAAKAKTDYEKTMAFIDKKNAAAAKAAGVGGNYRQEQADLLSGKTPGAVAPPPGFKIIGQ